MKTLILVVFLPFLILVLPLIGNYLVTFVESRCRDEDNASFHYFLGYILGAFNMLLIFSLIVNWFNLGIVKG